MCDRLAASSSIGFIIGPSVGGFLYKHVDERAPALVATCLFIVTFLLAAAFIPTELISGTTETAVHKNEQQDPTNGHEHEHENENEYKHGHKYTHDGSTEEKSKKMTRWAKYTSFTTNLRSCFSSKALGSLIIYLLLHHWVTRATSYANLASYYEELFGIEPHQRGYLVSYQKLFSFAFQSFFVQSSILAAGGEYNAARVAAAALVLSNLLQYRTPLIVSIGLACPMTSVSTSFLNTSLTSLITQAAPKHSLASVLAALDVLKNAVSVTVPFYRTFLFRLLGSIEEGNERATMVGDPSPLLWVGSSVLHWIFVVLVLTMLLPRGCTDRAEAVRSRKGDENDGPKKEL